MGKGDKKHRKKKKQKQSKKTHVKRTEIKVNDIKELDKRLESKNIKKDVAGKGIKMSYEIARENIKNFDCNNIIHFLKWNYVNTKKLENFKKKIKDTKYYTVSKTGNTISNINIENLSGIISDSKLSEFIDKLIPYSSILHAKIKLTAPYFSRDDDEFYLIQNPCLKEKVFKVPMVRGSGWKGVIAEAFRKLINENDNNNKKGMIQSYLRVFGAGSSEFRELEGMIDDFVNKGKTLSLNKLISYLLFELGLKLSKDDINKLKNEGEISNWLKNHILGNEDNELGKNSKKPIPVYLTTHKGRAIFYPTYFDKLSLEIINPHSRKTRAGTNPIHYEVVPEGSEGTLQIVYIPFDGILKKDWELEKEVKQDIDFLTQAIEKAREIGVGAKEKLGWGRFRLTNKRFCVNRTIGSEDINGWKQCEVNDEQ